MNSIEAINKFDNKLNIKFMALKKPWLLLPPKLAHDLGVYFLNALSLLIPNKKYIWRSYRWKNLTFNNPVGIAGGVDKNADNLLAWQKLGVGFIEVGTVTPLPQGPNPGKIMDRNIAQSAVWNKMGFPSKGLSYVLKQMQKHKNQLRVPVFINIGKNRSTPNENAHEDYIELINKLEPYADAFVVNISSPNTQGLRDLLKSENIKSFLTPIAKAKIKKPLLIKLSPDMDEAQLKTVLDVSYELNFDGWILTNTTLQRPIEGFPGEGGLSGAPLKEISKNLLKLAVTHLGERKNSKLLVAAGGIMNYQDVIERLQMGANIVQVYSTLIFEGPMFFKALAKMDQQQGKIGV